MLRGDLIALRLLAAPPGGDARQLQVFAEQMATDGRHEGEEGAGFENAGAERIDDRDGSASAAPRPCRACRYASSWFSSSGSAKAASRRRQSTPIGFKPGDGAHHDAAVDDGQVLAFEQHEAEIAGDIGVFEIGLVGEARASGRRCGRRDASCAPAARRGRRRRSRQGDGRGFRHRDRRRRGWSRRGFPARNRRLTAPRCDRTAPTSCRPGRGRSRRRQKCRIMAVGRQDADHRAQEFRIGGDQRRRQEALRRPAGCRRRYRRRSAPAVRRAGRRPFESVCHSRSSISTGIWESGQLRSEFSLVP